MIRVQLPYTPKTKGFDGSMKGLLALAKSLPIDPYGRGQNIFFYDDLKEVWGKVTRSRTGRDGVLGEFHVYRGRCGGDFGIAYDPAKVAELKKIWKSRNIKLING